MKTKEIMKAMKALSNPNRFKLFMEISKSSQRSYEKEECFIFDIIDKLNIGAPTISHHLKMSPPGLENRGHHQPQ